MNSSLVNTPKWQSVMRKAPLVLLVLLVGVALYGVLYPDPDRFQLNLLRTVSVAVILGFFSFFRLAPMVIVLGIGRAARHGILIRSGEIFSRLARMKTLFFDKTGTLTKGAFYFSQAFTELGVNQGTFLTTIFSLEAQCSHPLSFGVQTHPWYLEMQRHEVKDFENHRGLGICGVVLERGTGKRFAAVGNQRFLKRFQMHISRAMRERVEELESMGETVILCGWEGHVKGLMSFADTLRPDVKPLLTRLQKMRLKPLMITGDHDEMMGHLSYTHGLEQVYTRCLPQEKAKKIKNRQEKGEVVGMVSSSMDENEAFNQADVSIIISPDSPQAQKVVDVVVLGQSLLNLPDLTHYSRTVHGTLKYGTLLSLIYCAGATTLALFDFLNPMGSLMAMAFSGMLLTIFPLQLQKTRFASKVPEAELAEKTPGVSLVEEAAG